ncbi:hypothetical protein [Gracilibacillus dipsosauri]|uniref:Uncharacterized protein n=1 Tax=Gracilibacillus dipsosauri TaxID=178340 RepID=A0A317KYB3_9BACI|nr:hypothetical protein [Gracilibacillus dipsosauri]PWU68333.1 hypothetical protein DLJ74_07735 [Gracilibacillus dipsosauri]
MRYIGEHEFKIGSRFLFLSMAIQVIQSDIKRLEKHSPFKINEPYLELLHRLEVKATAERRSLKQEMYKERLKVIQTDKDGTFTEYTFICKGKEEKRRYFNPAIRTKVRNILDELIGDGETAKEKIN